jgi:hypothetical protein
MIVIVDGNNQKKMKRLVMWKMRVSYSKTYYTCNFSGVWKQTGIKSNIIHVNFKTKERI